jgi:hypothetical protein
MFLTIFSNNKTAKKQWYFQFIVKEIVKQCEKDWKEHKTQVQPHFLLKR